MHFFSHVLMAGVCLGIGFSMVFADTGYPITGLLLVAAGMFGMFTLVVEELGD